MIVAVQVLQEPKEPKELDMSEDSTSRKMSAGIAEALQECVLLCAAMSIISEC